MGRQTDDERLRRSDRHELEARGRRRCDDDRGRRQRGGCDGRRGARFGRHGTGRGGPGIGGVRHGLEGRRTSPDPGRRCRDARPGARVRQIRAWPAGSGDGVCRRRPHVGRARLGRHAGHPGEPRGDFPPLWTPGLGGSRGARLSARPQRIRAVVRFAHVHDVLPRVDLRLGPAQPGRTPPRRWEPEATRRDRPRGGAGREPAADRGPRAGGLLHGRAGPPDRGRDRGE